MSLDSWRYNPQTQEFAHEWLRSKCPERKSCRYPRKHSSKQDRNSIRIVAERHGGWLTASIDVDIEDESPTSQHWPGHFLFLSLQLRFNLRKATCPQSQIDAYLSYNTREVAAKDYRVPIEKYTRGKLELIYAQEGWRIRHLNQLRRALEFWNAEKLDDED